MKNTRARYIQDQISSFIIGEDMFCAVAVDVEVAFALLHERFTVRSAIGCLLITAGTLVMVL